MKIRVILHHLAAEANPPASLNNELQDSLTQLQRAENFKFVHLVSVLHEADEAGVKEEVFRYLIECMISYIEGNKQAIKYSLDKMSQDGQVFTSKRFNLAKFLTTLVLEDTKEGDELTFDPKYFLPLAHYINRLIISNDFSKQEMRDKLELIIGYQEAQWLSNTLWLQFVSMINEILPGQNNDMNA
jgi:hypothetical protein